MRICGSARLYFRFPCTRVASTTVFAAVVLELRCYSFRLPSGTVKLGVV